MVNFFRKGHHSVCKLEISTLIMQAVYTAGKYSKLLVVPNLISGFDFWQEHLTLKFSVPAKWTEWTRWSACSKTCGTGAVRTKSRFFIPGRHGGKTIPDGDREMSQDCLTVPDFPNPCPRPARYSGWSTWSSCRSCDPEGSSPQKSHRQRECIQAVLSNQWKFNIDIANCTNLAQTTMRQDRSCGLKTCPGEITYTLTLTMPSAKDKAPT